MTWRDLPTVSGDLGVDFNHSMGGNGTWLGCGAGEAASIAKASQISRWLYSTLLSDSEDRDKRDMSTELLLPLVWPDSARSSSALLLLTRHDVGFELPRPDAWWCLFWVLERWAFLLGDPGCFKSSHKPGLACISLPEINTGLLEACLLWLWRHSSAGSFCPADDGILPTYELLVLTK